VTAVGTLEGKVAIVTGSGRGVGQGVALALAGEGAAIVVCGRTPETLAETTELIAGRGGEAISMVCDVMEADQVEGLVQYTVDQLGAVDILVNNAQVVPLGRLLDVPDDSFEAGWLSGPLATFRLMRACHPYLGGGGVIVNLATGAAFRPDPVGYGCYTAVKEAIRALTRAAAVEWGPDGIRVHAIVPLASSPGFEWWAANRPDEFEAFRATVPLGRIGDTETDIGRVVVFLCGPDSSYITGGTLMIDGGQAFLR
jgi:meso-butanediol dehydrogenase / (S,S)-butanediol dehydrogenase / diacetyl reductase